VRPVRLEVEGFGAFLQRTVVDLDDVEVFALVGPTGAGKSTLLDAICFALYGSVPRYDDQRLVGAAMSLGANETRVRFTFEAAGTRYDAVRVVRRGRDGKVTTKEARLEVVDGPVLAGRAAEMAAAVTRVVGLPFEHFTRCVVLPQGAFARFLHDKPADRQQLLVQLLDLGIYERLATEANRRARDAEREADAATRSAQRLAHATDDAVAAAGARVDALAAAVGALDALAADDATAEAARRDAASTLTVLDGHLRALRAVAVPDDLPARRQARAAAAEAAAEAAAALTSADAALEAAEGERSAFGDAAGAEAVVRLAAGRPAKVAELEGLDRTAADAAGAAITARAAVAAAGAALTAAQAALEAARVASAAHAVREHLVVGAPCPVCEQAVLAVPERPAPPAWQRARDDEQARRADQEAAANRSAAADRAADRADAAADAARRTLEALDADVAAAGGLDAAAARVAEAARLDEIVAAARSAQRAARARRDAAQSALEAARAGEEALGAGYHAQRDALAGLDPPAPTGEVATDWVALEVWASEALDTVAAQRDEAQAALAAAEAATGAVARSVATVLEQAVVPAPSARPRPTRPEMGRSPLDAARDAVTHARADAEAGLATLQRDHDARIGEERAAAAAGEQARVARLLAQLLSANGFERWLVAAATEALVAAASLTLGRLSGGQYALALDESGELSVVDHTNAGERRSVRTLSGGETFQAALALALALAEQLRELSLRSGASLDSLFLDEGFGTLDPDSLEVVAATLENLGGQGRTVGIITHVRELAARLPVRFEVTRGPHGSTVRRELG
jgi:exonuclease SbcC